MKFAWHELQRNGISQPWRKSSLMKKCTSTSRNIVIESHCMSICMKRSSHSRKLIREIEDEDLQKLTQIPMIRITRFDANKADDTYCED